MREILTDEFATLITHLKGSKALNNQAKRDDDYPQKVSGIISTSQGSPPLWSPFVFYENRPKGISATLSHGFEKSSPLTGHRP